MTTPYIHSSYKHLSHFPNLTKGIYKKYTDYLILNGKNLSTLLLKSESKHTDPLLLLLFDVMLEVPTQGKEIKCIEIGKQKDMMAHTGNLVKYIF